MVLHESSKEAKENDKLLIGQIFGKNVKIIVDLTEEYETTSDDSDGSDYDADSFMYNVSSIEEFANDPNNFEGSCPNKIQNFYQMEPCIGVEFLTIHSIIDQTISFDADIDGYLNAFLKLFPERNNYLKKYFYESGTFLLFLMAQLSVPCRFRKIWVKNNTSCDNSGDGTTPGTNFFNK